MEPSIEEVRDLNLLERIEEDPSSPLLIITKPGIGYLFSKQ